MRDVWENKIFGFIAFLYLGILFYFAFQTFYFVTWLYPLDSWFVKTATVITFDGMSFVWSAACYFYRFHSKHARWWVSIGWLVTFLLSCGATICYYAVENLFRFHLQPSQDLITWGYVLTLVAVLFNILVCVRFFHLEWAYIHPHMDHWEIREQQAALAMPDNSRILDNNRIPQDSSRTTMILGNSGELPALPKSPALPRNTRPRAAAIAIVQKYGRAAVLSDIAKYAKEAGVSEKTMKRYAWNPEETEWTA